MAPATNSYWEETNPDKRLEAKAGDVCTSNILPLKVDGEERGEAVSANEKGRKRMYELQRGRGEKEVKKVYKYMTEGRDSSYKPKSGGDRERGKQARQPMRFGGDEPRRPRGEGAETVLVNEKKKCIKLWRLCPRQ